MGEGDSVEAKDWPNSSSPAANVQSVIAARGNERLWVKKLEEVTTSCDLKIDHFYKRNTEYMTLKPGVDGGRLLKTTRFSKTAVVVMGNKR